MNQPEHQDMKNLGFFGTLNHSFKTIFSRKKLFTQITFTLILPLSILFLAHIQISNHFFWKIENSYIITYSLSYRHTITLTDWLYYWLFKIIYFTFLTFFSLLSTSAVVFTIASVYSDRDVIFRQLILKVVPNIWKKLCVTFVFIYFGLFIYNVLSGVVLFVTRSLFGYTVIGSVVVLIMLVLYGLGFLYLSFVWQLACVVTVLENVYGFKAMKKGKVLANGKKKVGMGIGFVLYMIMLGLVLVYELFVEYGGEVSGLAMIWRVVIGILCVVMITKLFLMFTVTQTVLYLVCKSYHREVIDKLSLSTFLSAYTGETVVYPKPDEIQLGRVVQHQPLAQMV